MSSEPEPRSLVHRRRRPDTARTLAAVVLATVLWTSGCGEAPREAPVDTDTDTDTGSSAGAAAWASCTQRDLDSAERSSGELATSDGGDVQVTFVPDGPGPCAGALVVRGPDGLSGLDVTRMDLDVRTAQVVSPAGDDTGQLLRVDSTGHPRGGFRPHLFAVTETGLVEVELDGRPLLPFVATDGGALPMTATCPADGGVGIVRAATSKPPGILIAWDVRLTTYDVTDGGPVRTSSRQLEDHAADPLLRRDRPELFDTGSLFAGCSQPWTS
ncbi:MAG: hypothetical protein ACR2HA_01135 [Nocardioides sp.]